jgi:replicative DNA helicase
MDEEVELLEPHNVEAEEAFIGSILIDPHAIIRAAGLVRPADFYVERHAWIYHCMLELDREGVPIDLVTLSDRLQAKGWLTEIGGAACLTSLISATPTSIHLEYYGKLVKKYARLRRIIAGAGRLARSAHYDQDPDKALALAETVLLDITEQAEFSGFRVAGEIVSDYLERVDAMQWHGRELGLSTGLPGLDSLCGRLQKSDLVLLAGRPGMMKTALALKIVLSVIKAEQRVAMFSLEMSDGRAGAAHRRYCRHLPSGAARQSPPSKPAVRAGPDHRRLPAADAQRLKD